jgi:hypothetical protein
MLKQNHSDKEFNMKTDIKIGNDNIIFEAIPIELIEGGSKTNINIKVPIQNKDSVTGVQLKLIDHFQNKLKAAEYSFSKPAISDDYISVEITGAPGVPSDTAKSGTEIDI